MKKSLIKFFLIVILATVSFVMTIIWINDLNIKVDPELLNVLIENSNSINDENKVINTIVYTITNSSIKSPVDLLLAKYNSNINNNDNVVDKTGTISAEELVIKDESKLQGEPIFYIYNTHQIEKYKTILPGSSINYSVMDASVLLQEKLLKYNIYSVVEDKSIMDVLDSRGWKYAQSYVVSREYLDMAKKNNPSLKYYIDLHRDSVSKNISTTTIDGKTYARVLFVHGLENKNNKENRVNIERLNNYLNANYKGLSRGILERSGKGVNGVYNQDFSPFCILIEVGGEENTEIEVENTIEIIAKMLYLFSKGEI